MESITKGEKKEGYNPIPLSSEINIETIATGYKLTNNNGRVISLIVAKEQIKSYKRDRAIFDLVYIYSNNRMMRLNVLREGQNSIPIGLLKRDQLVSSFDPSSSLLKYHSTYS